MRACLKMAYDWVVPRATVVGTASNMAMCNTHSSASSGVQAAGTELLGSVTGSYRKLHAAARLHACALRHTAAHSAA